jgi:hypothetical protein
MNSLTLKTWMIIATGIFASQASANVLEKVERKLNRYSWSYSARTQSAHITFGYKFVNPFDGGIFSYAINGQRRSHQFAKYQVATVTSTDLKRFAKLTKKKFDFNSVRGVVILSDENDKTLNWLLIVNERCLLDVKNVGATTQFCLVPKR